MNVEANDMRWDLWVDFNRVDENGLTLASLNDVRAGVHLHQGSFVVVGDEDYAPAIAEVVELDEGDGFMRLRVIPGAAVEHPDLLAKATH